MSTKATTITQGAYDSGVNVSGSSQYRGQGSIGDKSNVTISDNSKAMDFSGATGSTITIGDPTAALTYAQSIEKLSASNNAAISGLLGGLSQTAAPAAATPGDGQPNWLLLSGLAVLLGLGAWLLRRR